MGLFTKIKGEFIDIIDWVDNTQDTMIWKFPRYQNEIKMNAKLTVRESQVAIFLNEGKIADVFQPGMYTLSTQNMPILTTLQGWKYGFNSPFKADVFYVSTRQFTNLKWGTKNPITLNDDRFGFVEFRAFGNYSIRVKDGVTFFKEITGTNPEYDTSKIDDQLRTWIMREVTDSLGESGIAIEKIAGSINELSDAVKGKIAPKFTSYGLELSDFNVENVSMPEELKKEIFELSRLDKINIQKLAQLKTAKAIEEAAKNEGTAGAGIGMGMGFGMGNMMTNMMGQNMMQQQQQQNVNTITPPPINNPVQFFVAVNNQQTGPFTDQVLGQMIQQGTLKRETMVWKTGMAAWAQAGNVPELAGLFNSVPPPIG